LVVGFTLAGAAVATALTRSGTAVRWFADVGTVLALIAEIKIWVRANRTALAVGDAYACCTSSRSLRLESSLPAMLSAENGHAHSPARFLTPS
jgi:hypothetical protein